VAVPIREVPTVLRDLAALDPGHLTLMLDTPVLDARDLRTARLFSRFAAVLASEDAVAYPPIAAARSLIEGGEIGRPRQAFMFHGGYRYHALASFRHLAGGNRPTRITVRRWSPKAARWTATFADGFRGTAVEPLRHEAQRLLIVGDRRAIADYPLGERAIEIGYRWEGQAYSGLSIGSQPAEETELDRLFSKHVNPQELPDRSLHAQLKIRGFMDLLAALDDPTSPFRCDPFEALHDSISLRIAERVRYLPDPRIARGRTLLGQAIRSVAGIGPTAR
jgi:hypothetical protein